MRGGRRPPIRLFLGLPSAVRLHWSLLISGVPSSGLECLCLGTFTGFAPGFSHHGLLMIEYFYDSGLSTIWECGAFKKSDGNAD